MTISIIVAEGLDRAIGRDNDLLWRLSGDLKRFKATTMGHTILMGRNTYASLPKGALPGRRNVVVSTQISTLPDADVFASVEEALDNIRQAGETELFVIGGAMLYRTMLPYTDRLYLTTVEAYFPDADAHFPEIDFSEWKQCGKEEYFEADERNEYSVRVALYERKAATKKEFIESSNE